MSAVVTRALIIGSGFSGLGMGIALQKQGFKGDDFLILEKADEIGGTWRDNTYPRVRVRYPVAHVLLLVRAETRLDPYVVVSAGDLRLPQGRHRQARAAPPHPVQHPRGSRALGRGRCALACLRQVGGAGVHRAVPDLGGAGGLHIPSIPEVEGADTFTGAMFHSAQWDHRVDLAGKRVAVIGTGASAIQIVPAIIDQVAGLDLYQRTPPAWVMPPGPITPSRNGSGSCSPMFRAPGR